MTNWRSFRARYQHLIRAIHNGNPHFWNEFWTGILIRDQWRDRTVARFWELPETREQGTQTEGDARATWTSETQTSRSLRTVGTQTELCGDLGEMQRELPPEDTPSPGLGRGRGQSCLVRLGETAELPREAPMQPLRPSCEIVAHTQETQPGSARERTQPRRPSRTRFPRSRPTSMERRSGRPSRSRSPCSLPRTPRSPKSETPTPSAGPLLPRSADHVELVRSTQRANVCWNCRSTSHLYSSCPMPKDRLYCYGCGREGETMRTCPRCRTDWRDLGPYHPDKGHMGRLDP